MGVRDRDCFEVNTGKVRRQLGSQDRTAVPDEGALLRLEEDRWGQAERVTLLRVWLIAKPGSVWM